MRLFGINGEWEGTKEKSEQATTNVYRIGTDGKLTPVITDLVNPNGLAFSPDETKLYVVEWKGTSNRSIWSFDVAADGSVSNKDKLIDANGPGSLDGFKVDMDGNLWCGWGSNGSPGAKAEELDGVMVFNPQGKAIPLKSVDASHKSPTSTAPTPYPPLPRTGRGMPPGRT